MGQRHELRRKAGVESIMPRFTGHRSKTPDRIELTGVKNRVYCGGVVQNKYIKGEDLNNFIFEQKCLNSALFIPLG